MTNDAPIVEAAVRNVKTVCPYCGVGCGMILQVESNRVVKVMGDREHPANFGRLCTKGSLVGHTLRASDRLAAAHIRSDKKSDPGRVPLDLALRETAGRLEEIITRHGPDSVAIYVSGQLSMESQYLAGKLAKGLELLGLVEQAFHFDLLLRLLPACGDVLNDRAKPSDRAVVPEQRMPT